MSSYDVVVVGSLNLDLVAQTPRLPGPGETVSGTSYAEYAGGKGLNQAVSAARSGGRVAMVGAVGDDHAGRELRSVVGREGIDDAAVATLHDLPTGRAMISVDDVGENSIIVIAGANGAVTGGDIPAADVVLAQLEVPTAAVVRAFAAARSAGATTVLNPAPAAELPDELLELCDVVVPNEHELELIGGAANLFERGVRDVVVTLGADGAEWRRREAPPVRVAPFAVSPVDTTGAGDAFCGALARRIAAGDDMRTALDHAAAAGALATTTPGAVPSQPYEADVTALVTQRSG